MSTSHAIPQVLIDFAWYQDGSGLIGRCPKVKLPELTKVVEEYIAGGMAAPIDIDMGMVEKMEITPSLAEPNVETIKLFGLSNGNEKPFTFRGALRGKGDAVPMVIRTTGRVIGLNIDEIERKKLASTECKITVATLKVEINGEVLIDIDAEGGKFVVGGVDQRASINAALGV
mgnify:CR=1 FL=1